MSTSSTSSQGAVAANPAGASAIALAAERDEARGRAIAGVLWMVAAQVCFAAMNVLARLASQRVPWPEVAASRTLIGAATVLAVALARRASLRIEPRDRRLSWARSLCGTCAMLCVFYTLGAPKIALGDAVTLGATSPIFVALLAPRLLGERSGPGLWVAATFAFVGVALVAGPSLTIAGGVALVATLGAIFSAFAMIWLRRLGAAVRAAPEAVALHFSLVASVAAVALSVPSFRPPDGVAWVLLVATGLAGGLGQITMTLAYSLDRAARIGTVGYLGVVLSHLLGVVALGEAPSAHQIAGTTLVLAAGLGLALHALREARREGAPTR